MTSKVTQMDCRYSENGNTKNISESPISEFSRQSERFSYNVQHDWSETFIKRYFIGPEAYHLFTYIPRTGK